MRRPIPFLKTLRLTFKTDYRLSHRLNYDYRLITVEKLTFAPTAVSIIFAWSIDIRVHKRLKL